MAYSTQSDLEDLIGLEALIEISDLDHAGVVDAVRVAAAIKRADGIIDSYLGQKFRPQLADVPDSISTLSAEWAIRILRARAYKGQPIAEDQRAEEIDRKWLAGVAAGTISLGVEPNPDKASKVVDKAAPRDSTLLISLERMKGFI